MKKIILWAIFIAFVFTSCGQQNQKILTFESFCSQNQEYKVEIPSDVPHYKSIGDFMSFINDKTRTTISIVKTDFTNLIDFANGDNNSGFNYEVIEQSDSSLFYNVTRGSQLWNGYKLYMQKEVGGKTYVIIVYSDTESKEILYKAIKHIYSSLSRMDAVEVTTDTTSIEDTSLITYAKGNYSIDYPKSWTILEKPDQMSDVYIGDASGKIGFTILHFETDSSLKEVNEESNDKILQAGISVKKNNLININGLECYQTVMSFSVNETDVQQISYTLKMGNTIYNIKFGNDAKVINSNEDLINRIIYSLKIK